MIRSVYRPPLGEMPVHVIPTAPVPQEKQPLPLQWPLWLWRAAALLLLIYIAYRLTP